MQNDIIIRLKCGDVTALEETYTEYAGALYSYCMSISARKENAEDAVADTFIKFYNYISSGRDIDNIKAFLYVTARNTLYDNLRFVSKEVPLPEEDTFEDSDCNVDEKIFIQEVIGMLPLDEKEIVTLYLFSGFKHKEISGILRLPESTVRWKYRQALKRLRERLGDSIDE